MFSMETRCCDYCNVNERDFKIVYISLQDEESQVISCHKNIHYMLYRIYVHFNLHPYEIYLKFDITLITFNSHLS